MWLSDFCISFLRYMNTNFLIWYALFEVEKVHVGFETFNNKDNDNITYFSFHTMCSSQTRECGTSKLFPRCSNQLDTFLDRIDAI